MAGTERAGPAGAEPERLFGATFVLTPAREDATGLARAEAFVRAVGARPVVMDAAEHDRLVALTSHLPHLLAYALVASAAGGRPDASPREHAGAPTDQALRDLISTGFLGATRLAESDPSSVAAFLSANAPAAARAAGLFADSLDAMVGLLEDAAGLESALRAARDDRRRLTGEAGP
jgi:prephenate dehydrogenase